MFPITKKILYLINGFFPSFILLIVGILLFLVLQQELMKNMTYYLKTFYILSYFIGYDLFFSQLSMKNLILLSIGIFTVSFF